MNTRQNRNPFAWPSKEVFQENGTAKTLGRYALAWAIAGPIVGPIMLAKKAHEWWNDANAPTKEFVKAQEEAQKLEQKFLKERNVKQPRALPTKRPRALSICEKEDRQKDCMLFSKLPQHVRMGIWESVVGGHTIAIFGGNRRLLHHVIEEAELKSPVDYSQGMPQFPSKSTHTSLSALLKTCRKIYNEAIPLLYTENKFITYHNYTLTDLQSTIIPQRLASIQHLELHFQFRSPQTFSRNPSGSLTHPQPPPFSPDTWQQTCTILSTMTSLASLLVIIRGPFEANSGIVEALEELRKVRVKGRKGKSGTYRVRAPWPRVIAKTGNEGVDRRFEDKKFNFEVFRPEFVIPDKWTGFEWARD